MSPEPDVQSLELGEDVSFILLASDGLTNVLTPGVVSDYLKKFEREEKVFGISILPTSIVLLELI